MKYTFINLFLLSILLCLLCYVIFKKDNIANEDYITTNNAFNNFGIKYIRPLLKNPKWVTYVDKLKFKQLCNKLNIKTFKTLYILQNPTDLYFLYNKLPLKFVVKSNKAFNRNVIVKDKYAISPNEIITQLSNYDDPFNSSTEPQYDYTYGKLFIEEYIDPIPEDIKIVFYKNTPTILWVDSDRFKNRKRDVYKIKNNKLYQLKNCYWNYPTSKNKNLIIEDIKKKNKVKKMLDIAKSFNVNLPLYRVDLYWLKNEFYGGEITLSSGQFIERISNKCARLSVQKY